VKLSVVVVVYNMRRAAPRTLLSLTPRYQRGISAEDYEVIVIENGSTQPLDRDAVLALAPNFSYTYVEKAKKSPVSAVNLGLRQARGEMIGVLIDGARIVTPNLLQLALRAAQTQPRAVVVTPGWTLGRESQNVSMERGFTEAQEDALLAEIGWPAEPSRLFEIATLDGSSALFGPIAESNTLFMRRELWDELEGMDEGFDQPGGGLVNLDTLERALSLPHTEMLFLLGEASFHQMHGGISTNSLPHQLASDLDQWHLHYRNLRQREWRLPKPRIVYYGTMPSSYRSHVIEWGSRQTLERVRFLRDALEELQNAANLAELRVAGESARADAAERRAALLRAELDDLRGSFSVRVVGGLALRVRTALPPGSLQRRVATRAIRTARWLLRWRWRLLSRIARDDLRAAWSSVRPVAPGVPEIQRESALRVPFVFDVEEWDETPLLHAADVEELTSELWRHAERTSLGRAA